MFLIRFTKTQIDTISNNILSYYDRGASIRLKCTSYQKQNYLDQDLWYHPPPYKE
jgi:DNA polymerase IIIc chi subunit